MIDREQLFSVYAVFRVRPTILEKTNETSRPPLPRFNDVRMARFCSSRLQHCFEEEGGLIVPFYSVQDCGRSGVNLSPANF